MGLGLVAMGVLLVIGLASPSADAAFSGACAGADSGAGFGARDSLGQGGNFGIILVEPWADVWVRRAATLCISGVGNAAGWVVDAVQLCGLGTSTGAGAGAHITSTSEQAGWLV
jgi:hypothetical protein